MQEHTVSVQVQVQVYPVTVQVLLAEHVKLVQEHDPPPVPWALRTRQPKNAIIADKIIFFIVLVLQLFAYSIHHWAFRHPPLYNLARDK